MYRVILVLLMTQDCHVICNGTSFMEVHNLVEELLGSYTRSYLSESTIVSKGEDDLAYIAHTRAVTVCRR